jgi:Tfp pilus assembly protein PilZ
MKPELVSPVIRFAASVCRIISFPVIPAGLLFFQSPTHFASVESVLLIFLFVILDSPIKTPIPYEYATTTHLGSSSSRASGASFHDTFLVTTSPGS